MFNPSNVSCQSPLHICCFDIILHFIRNLTLKTVTLGLGALAPSHWTFSTIYQLKQQ
jgi:hypothetical protein